MQLKIGDKAPDFKLKDQNNTEVKLDDLKGKITLIYFYPKDETPGCTAQACSLRDNFELLQDSGVGVIGVSKDSVSSHEKFSNKHQLPFSVLSDEQHKMIEDYGAWQERSMYGRKFFGTQRSAVLIGPDLKVIATWPKIQPLKTVDEVLKWLKENH